MAERRDTESERGVRETRECGDDPEEEFECAFGVGGAEDPSGGAGVEEDVGVGEVVGVDEEEGVWEEAGECGGGSDEDEACGSAG